MIYLSASWENAWYTRWLVHPQSASWSLMEYQVQYHRIISRTALHPQEVKGLIAGLFRSLCNRILSESILGYSFQESLSIGDCFICVVSVCNDRKTEK